MGKAGAPIITADTPVPHTKGIKYGQLCNVRRKSGLEIRTGQLLAYEGSWDRKAVVTHVTYMGSYEKHGYIYHAFTIGIQQLGSFYSTGALRPSKCAPKELEVETSGTLVGDYHMQRWTPVEAFVPPQKQATLTMAKGEQFQYSGSHVPLVADNHPSADALQAAADHNADHKQNVHTGWSANAGKPAAAKAPEAILDEFLIKPVNLEA